MQYMPQMIVTEEFACVAGGFAGTARALDLPSCSGSPTRSTGALRVTSRPVRERRPARCLSAPRGCWWPEAR